MTETSVAQPRPVPRTSIEQPFNKAHPITTGEAIEQERKKLEGTQEMMSLLEWMQKVNGKPRGTKGGADDLNSHFEEFIVQGADGQFRVATLSEIQDILQKLGADVKLLGLHSIGNANQRVTNMVHGVNKKDPKSGFERPVTAEGPHMILAPYAFDEKGNLHVFRTIQKRTGAPRVDTTRGFADQETLKSGQQLYKVEGSEGKVDANLKRILKEEGGEKMLHIKKVVYLGAHVVNGSFVTSKSALFGVEVDYDKFRKLKNVITEEEAKRRKEQFAHEGLTDVVVDMTASEYAHYKEDTNLTRDLAADAPTDVVMIGFMARKIQDYENTVKRRARQARNLGYIVKLMGEGHSKKDAVKLALLKSKQEQEQKK